MYKRLEKNCWYKDSHCRFYNFWDMKFVLNEVFCLHIVHLHCYYYVMFYVWSCHLHITVADLPTDERHNFILQNKKKNFFNFAWENEKTIKKQSWKPHWKWVTHIWEVLCKLLYKVLPSGTDANFQTFEI